MRQRKKLVYGVGINDSDYRTQGYEEVDGKRKAVWRCPYYRIWQKMLERCYSERSLKVAPTYRDVTVCKQWHRFMTFRRWMVAQDWEGKHLDKDILNPSSREYGPNSCVFVSQQLNGLLVTCKKSRGEYPLGVSYNKQHGKFIARHNASGRKSKFLGLFDNPKSASIAYCKAKSSYIRDVAVDQEKKIRDGLLVWADLYERGKVL